MCFNPECLLSTRDFGLCSYHFEDESMERQTHQALHFGHPSLLWAVAESTEAL